MKENIERAAKYILTKMTEKELEILLMVGHHELPPKREDKIKILYSLLLKK